MKNTITTTLDSVLYTFLDNEAKRHKVPRKAVLEKALNLYKKQQLEQAVRTGLQERQEEYVRNAAAFREAQNISLTE